MRFNFKISILTASLFIGNNLFSQNIKNSKYTTQIFEAHRIIDSLQQTQNIPGLDIAISIDGEIVWSEGFGFADLEHHVPIKTGETRFRVGSISKPLTAAALGKLIEDNKLNLDENIQTYVPYFPEKKYKITVKQLAGHLGGVRSYKDNEFNSSIKYNSVKDALNIFINDTLIFEPGTQYAYSTYGFNLLSAAIEGTSGENYLDFMQNEIFLPLNMTSTLADKNENIIPNRSALYQIDSNNTIQNATYVDNSNKWAGGGFLSTTHDLITFGNAMIDAEFLSHKTIKLLTKSQALNNGKKTGYGVGWGIIKRKQLKGFGHHGECVGGSTKFEVFPKEKLVFIVVSNASNINYGNTVERIIHTFIDNK